MSPILYWADVSRMNTAPDLYPISEDRRAALSALKNENVRQQGLGAELLLIYALQQLDHTIQLPLPISRTNMGKPVLDGLNWQFSLSHTGSYAACCVYDRPLGIDIQETKHVPERFLTRFYTADEKKTVLDSAEPDETFTRIWCRKESLLKASGLGLSVDLKSFEVLRGELDFQNRRYSFQSGQTEAFHYAFCCEGNCKEPLTVQRVILP